MSLSGSFKTNSYDGRYYKLSWKATQDISKNQSKISWTLEALGQSGSYYAERTLILKLAGKTLINKTDRVERYDGVVKTGSFTLSHSNDGTKSFSGSLKVAVYTSSVNCTGSGNFTLNTIPRQATITSAPDFNDLENPVIKYYNPANNNVTSLQACISLTGSKADIPYRDISKTGNSYTFNLTAEERKTLLINTVGSNDRTVKFFVKTVIGGNTYYSSITRTFTVMSSGIDCKNVSVEDTNQDTLLLTGGTRLVRYMSNVCAQFDVESTNYATITGRKITCGNKTVKSTESSGDMQIGYIESEKFVFGATDSRTEVMTLEFSEDFVPYIKPTCSITNVIASADGIVSFEINGNVYSGVFDVSGLNSNTLTVSYTLDGEYMEVSSDNVSVSDNKYSANVKITDLDYTRTYTIKANVSDSLCSVDSNEYVLSFNPIFDWSKDDFHFNVDVYIQGKLNGFDIGKNKVLWSGGNYMTAEHTAYLKELISQQSNGIVLVFSTYNSDTKEVHNNNFNSFFVSKYEVSAHNGSGHIFTMFAGALFGTPAAKYLNIYDNRIKGNNDNYSQGTGSSGIAYNNKNFVLRYVIGV